MIKGLWVSFCMKCAWKSCHFVVMMKYNLNQLQNYQKNLKI
jgi:hypothetical protein